MRAARCVRLTGPSGVEIAQLPPPRPGPHDVRVSVAYAALNFMDLLITAGTYQEKPELPFVPGHDAAGEIIEVGSEVTTFRPGHRISVGVSFGAFAEELVAPATRAVRVPDGIDLRLAAAYRASYATALYSLQTRAHLRSGENLVVTGAAGGVGLASLQVAKLLGAKSVGLVGSEEKASVVRAEGADAIVTIGSQNIVDEISRRFPNGFDVALDTVGGNGFLDLVRTAGWDSRILTVGFTAGIPNVALNRLLLKSTSVVGVNYGAGQDKNLAATADIHRTLLQWIKDGLIKPRIAAEFPLEQTRSALELLAQRKSAGKILIRVR